MQILYVSQSTALSAYGGCHETLNGIHVIESAGDDIWGASNKFWYAYKGGQSGSKTLSLREDQLENTSDWARADIMIRTGTGSTDAFVAVFTTPNNGIVFQDRASNGAATTTQFGTVTAYPGTMTKPKGTPLPAIEVRQRYPCDHSLLP